MLGIDGHPSYDPSASLNMDQSVVEREEVEEEDDGKIPDESRISKALSEQIQKIVVLICLILLFLLPLTQIETYRDSGYLLHDKGMAIAVDLYDEQTSWQSYQDAIKVLIAETGSASYYPMIWLRIADNNPIADEFNQDMVDVYPNGGSIGYL